MAGEGVIRVVRTEQQGNLPARTVYEITPEGRAELTAIRDHLLRDTRLRPDPVDLALQNALDMSEDELRAVMEVRRAEIAASLAAWRHLQDSAAPFLTPLEAITFRHTLARADAELAWHDEFLAMLPKLFAPGPPSARP